MGDPWSVNYRKLRKIGKITGNITHFQNYRKKLIL